MAETTEPLAKFHARLDPKGRVLIPKSDREILGIESNDYVEVIIRKIQVDHDSMKISVLDRAFLIAKVGARGYFIIPTETRHLLNLDYGDIVEVFLLTFHKFDELISEKGKSLLSRIQTYSHSKIISAEEEKIMLNNSSHSYLFTV